MLTYPKTYERVFPGYIIMSRYGKHATDDLIVVTRNGCAHGEEVCTSCQPLDRFSLMLLRGPIPSCLLISAADFSLVSSTCLRV